MSILKTLANMTMDGEEVDGVPFVMENDDAVSTLNQLIEQARKELAEDVEYCHGYDLEDCRTHFVPEDVNLTDEQIREIMAALRDDDAIEGAANAARYEAMQYAFESLVDELEDEDDE